MPSPMLPAAAPGLPADPTRRRALAALAGFGGALALPRPAHATPHPDAQLLALGAEHDALEAEAAALRPLANALDAPDSILVAYDALEDQTKLLGDRIAALPATTLDGFGVKARALAAIYHEGLSAEGLCLGPTTDHRLVWSILAGLLTATSAGHLVEGGA